MNDLEKEFERLIEEIMQYIRAFDSYKGVVRKIMKTIMFVRIWKCSVNSFLPEIQRLRVF